MRFTLIFSCRNCSFLFTFCLVPKKTKKKKKRTRKYLKTNKYVLHISPFFKFLTNQTVHYRIFSVQFWFSTFDWAWNLQANNTQIHFNSYICVCMYISSAIIFCSIYSSKSIIGKLPIWSLTFSLCVNLVLDLSNVSIWSLTFWYYVKMIRPWIIRVSTYESSGPNWHTT